MDLKYERTLWTYIIDVHTLHILWMLIMDIHQGCSMLWTYIMDILYGSKFWLKNYGNTLWSQYVMGIHFGYNSCLQLFVERQFFWLKIFRLKIPSHVVVSVQH